ncbi:uncharacterized protein LOC144720436 isoform X3 [Lampetra planeri]
MQQHPRPTFMASPKSRAAPSEVPAGKLCVHYVLVRHKVNGFGSLVAINSVLPTGQVLHIAPEAQVPRVIKPPPEGVVLVPASQLQTPGAAERALLARAGIATDVRVYLLPVLHGRSGSRGSLCASSVPRVPTTPARPRLTPHRAWHRPQPQEVAERRSTRLQKRSPRGAALPSLQHQPCRKRRLVPLVDVASLGTVPPWPRSHGDGASQETCEASEGSPCGSDDIIFSSGDNGACNGMDWTNEVSWEGDVGESGGEAGSAPDPPPTEMATSPAGHHDDAERRDRLSLLRFALREKQEAVEEALTSSRLHY